MITNMIAEDIPQVLDLMRTLRAESVVFQRYPEDKPWVEANLALMTQSPSHIMLVDEDDTGTIRGVMFGCLSSPWWSPYYEASEMLLAVVPKYRNSSVAYHLIKEFERGCAKRNARAINVGSNLGIDDGLAEALYRRMGYEPFGHALTKRLD